MPDATRAAPGTPLLAEPPAVPAGFTPIVGHPGYASNEVADIVTCVVGGHPGFYRAAWRPIPTAGVPKLWALIPPRPDKNRMPELPEGCAHVADLPGLARDAEGRFHSCRNRGGFQSKNPATRRFTDGWRRLELGDVRRQVPAHLIPAAAPKAAPFPKPQAEREAMLAQVARLVGKWVRQSGVPKDDREDAEQDAKLELWKYTESFDPNRGVRWSTYASVIVKRMVSKKAGAIKSRAEVHTDDWDQFPAEAQSQPHDLEPDGEEIEGETAAQLFDAIQRVLTDGLLDAVTSKNGGPDEATLSARKIVEAIAFDGLTVRDLAIQSGHPEKVVRANLKNAIRTLQKRGLTQHVLPDAHVNAILVPNPVKNEQQKLSKRRRAPKYTSFVADPWKSEPVAGGDSQEPVCPDAHAAA